MSDQRGRTRKTHSFPDLVPKGWFEHTRFMSSIRQAAAHNVYVQYETGSSTQGLCPVSDRQQHTRFMSSIRQAATHKVYAQYPIGSHTTQMSWTLILLYAAWVSLIAADETQIRSSQKNITGAFYRKKSFLSFVFVFYLLNKPWFEKISGKNGFSLRLLCIAGHSAAVQLSGPNVAWLPDWSYSLAQWSWRLELFTGPVDPFD